MFLGVSTGKTLNRKVGVLRSIKLGWRPKHSGSDSGIGFWVNENKRTGESVGRVAIKDQRLGCAQADLTNIVQGLLIRLGFRFVSVNINATVQAPDHGLHGLCTVF